MNQTLQILELQQQPPREVNQINNTLTQLSLEIDG